jgi:hypothetical protein
VDGALTRNRNGRHDDKAERRGNALEQEDHVRVTAEEFAEIRRRAYAAGRDIEPAVDEWIRPRLLNRRRGG